MWNRAVGLRYLPLMFFLRYNFVIFFPVYVVQCNPFICTELFCKLQLHMLSRVVDLFEDNQSFLKPDSQLLSLYLIHFMNLQKAYILIHAG